MYQPGQRVNYADTGYTGSVVQAGLIPDSAPCERQRGQQGYLISWDALDEMTGLPDRSRGTDGQDWVPCGHVSPELA